MYHILTQLAEVPRLCVLVWRVVVSGGVCSLSLRVSLSESHSHMLGAAECTILTHASLESRVLRNSHGNYYHTFYQVHVFSSATRE